LPVNRLAQEYTRFRLLFLLNSIFYIFYAVNFTEGESG